MESDEVKITTQILKKANACDDALPWFDAAFPGGIEITEKTVSRVQAERPDYLVWGLGNLPVKVVEAMLDAGAAVNATDESGRTPLHLAAWWGRTDTARLMKVLEKYDTPPEQEAPQG